MTLLHVPSLMIQAERGRNSCCFELQPRKKICLRGQFFQPAGQHSSS